MADEHKGIAKRWIDRTRQVLIEEMRRLQVKDSGDLQGALQSYTKDLGEGYTEVGLRFPTYGRFVDMGAGRRAKLNALSKRKAKKWYSPAFYGRLNTLQGVLGIELMEQSVNALKDGIEGR